MKRHLAAALAGAALALLAWQAPGAAQAARASQPVERERAVAVEAYPFEGFSALNPSRRTFGRLTFLGGLELRGKDAAFGGISGFSIDADGLGFLAITDHATWIAGRFRAEGDRLTGIGEVRLTPMVSPRGRRMQHTQYYDTEGLVRDGRFAYVSVERAHDIVKFDLSEGLSVRGALVPVPAGMKRLSVNSGIEALGIMPRQSGFAGALIAIAESPPRGAEHHPGFLIGGRQPGEFQVRRSASFDITDLAFLPGGDMLTLERRFRPLLGLAFRIRRIALGSIRPGALLDGEVLIEADLSQQIDNMEALAIHRAADGRVILTIVSDDNFSLLQRTLVLRFAMEE